MSKPKRNHFMKNIYFTAPEGIFINSKIGREPTNKEIKEAYLDKIKKK